LRLALAEPPPHPSPSAPDPVPPHAARQGARRLVLSRRGAALSATGERPLRVALLGSRGIPARYGGYETLMEELARRLVARGVEVTVYCRSHATPPGLREHAGARLVVLPTLRGKPLDTPVHTLLACLHARGQGYDAVLMVNSANAVFLPILRSAGVPVALNVD